MTRDELGKLLNDMYHIGGCDATDDAIGNIMAMFDAQAAEIERLQQWVNDLHSGMYINCVYCGHRYGPNDEVPSSMADVLKEHIEKCPEHPMSKCKTEVERLRAALEIAYKAIENLPIESLGECSYSDSGAECKYPIRDEVLNTIAITLKGGE